jgi:hypothetical protein
MDDNKNFNNSLPALTESSPLQIFSLAIAISCTLICTPLFYCIIWFEKFGSDKKRTLINKLLTMNCWNAMGYLIFVQTIEIFRFICGPLPLIICNVKNVLKFATMNSFILNTDAAIFANYAYIFWLKNPAAFHDEFWCQFISAWIHCASLLIMVALHMIDEFQIQTCFICSGKIATEKLKTTTMGGIRSILIASVLLHLVLRSRIFNYKKVRAIHWEGGFFE